MSHVMKPPGHGLDALLIEIHVTKFNQQQQKKIFDLTETI